MKMHRRALTALWLLTAAGFAIYAASAPMSPARLLSPALSGSLMTGAFLIHGLRWLGPVRLALFAACWLIVPWIAEHISMTFGVPFGQYSYTELMAPFVLGIPAVALAAYVVVGYSCFFTAHLICGPLDGDSRARRLARAVIAATLMTSWDLCADPVRATVEGRWVWPEGGMHLGVPLPNYAGWMVMMLVTAALFETVQSRLSTRPPTPAWSAGLFVTPVVMYMAVAVEYLTYLFVPPADAAAAEICRQSGLTALVLMIPPALLALVRCQMLATRKFRAGEAALPYAQS